MKKYVAMMMVCLAVMGANSVKAQGDEDESALWQPSLTVKVYDNYITPALATQNYDKPVVQSDVYIEMPYGFGFDVWNSSGFNSDLSGGWDDELDYILSWDGELGPAEISLGIEYWDLYSNVGSFGGEDVWVYSAKATAPAIEQPGSEFFPTITAAPYIEGKLYEVRDETETGGGAVCFVGVSSALTYSGNPSCIGEVDYAVGYDDGAFGASKAGIFRLSMSLTWSLSENLALILPEVIISAPFSHDDDRQTRSQFGGGLTYNF